MGKQRENPVWRVVWEKGKIFATLKGVGYKEYPFYMCFFECENEEENTLGGCLESKRKDGSPSCWLFKI